MTVKEITYMVLDELKNSSDDRFFEEEHIVFLLGKYRAFLLKQRYSTDIKKYIPESNYQTICLDLEEVPIEEGFCYAGPRLVSAIEVPYMMNIGNRRVFAMKDFTTTNFAFVSLDRFNFVGFNKWLNNIIYATIGPDKRLYLKSNNPQYRYLENIRLNGVFEDFETASDYACDTATGEDCPIVDFMDRIFPIEDALVSPLIELVVKDLTAAIYKPIDQGNNAQDDLSKVGLAVKE